MILGQAAYALKVFYTEDREVSITEQSGKSNRAGTRGALGGAAAVVGQLPIYHHICL